MDWIPAVRLIYVPWLKQSFYNLLMCVQNVYRKHVAKGRLEQKVIEVINKNCIDFTDFNTSIAVGVDVKFK